MELAKVVLFCFSLVLATQASWPVSKFPDILRKIYKNYYTCARELNQQIFDMMAGDDKKLSKEEAKEKYEEAAESTGLLDAADFEKDFKKLSLGLPNVRAPRLLTFSRLNAIYGGDINTFDHMVATALHDKIDANDDAEIEESEILEYTDGLAEMSARPITAKDYVGCMSHLIPDHMGSFFGKVWDNYVLKKFDKGAILSDADEKGDGKLGPKEMKRMFIGSASIATAIVQGKVLSYASLIDEFDKNGDGLLEKEEFVENMLEHVKNMDLPDVGITFRGFLDVYDTNNNLLVSPNEAEKFLEDAGEDEGSGSED